MALSGVEAAIREREQKRIREAILLLRLIRPQSLGQTGRRGRRRFSALARRRIAEASKKPWAALRAPSKSRK